MSERSPENLRVELQIPSVVAVKSLATGINHSSMSPISQTAERVSVVQGPSSADLVVEVGSAN